MYGTGRFGFSNVVVLCNSGDVPAVVRYIEQGINGDPMYIDSMTTALKGKYLFLGRSGDPLKEAKREICNEVVVMRVIRHGANAFAMECMDHDEAGLRARRMREVLFFMDALYGVSPRVVCAALRLPDTQESFFVILREHKYLLRNNAGLLLAAMEADAEALADIFVRVDEKRHGEKDVAHMRASLGDECEHVCDFLETRLKRQLSVVRTALLCMNRVDGLNSNVTRAIFGIHVTRVAPSREESPAIRRRLNV